MTTLKQHLLFWALSLLPLTSVLSQTAFSVEPETLQEALEYIESAYGEQIEIGMDEISAFLSDAINEDDYSQDCTSPEVAITEYDLDFITFSWDAPLVDVAYFEHRSLNLYTGENEYNTTDEGEATYFISSDFYLFLFNSVCTNEKKSKVQIIIVDKDVMFELPPDDRGCDCRDPTIVSLIKQPMPPGIPGPILGFAQAPWNSKPACQVTKYIINIDDINHSGYEASAYILHNPNHSPEKVYLHTFCSTNFFSPNPYNINPGDIGKYHLEFNNNIRVNIEDASIMQNAIITLSTCECESDSRSEIAVREIQNVDFKVTCENPVYDQISLKVNLQKADKLSVQLFDVFGQAIVPGIFENKATGSHRLKIPVSQLSSGIYTCLVKSGNQTKAIKIIKVK